MNKTLKEILSTSIYLLVVLILTLLVVTYVGQRTKVIGNSMSPMLSDGDNLIVDKISYRFQEPQRFDIIVFPFRYAEKLTISKGLSDCRAKPYVLTMKETFI